MPEYKLYPMKAETNHISGAVTVIVCATDKEATDKAQQLVDGADIEIWTGSQYLTRIYSPERKSHGPK